MGIFSNKINESNNQVAYTNVNEVVKTDWTTVKVRSVNEDGTPHFEDEPMVPFTQFSKHAKDIIDCEVIAGQYDCCLLKFKTFYGGSITYPIHRDCNYSIGDHPKLEDVLVVRLVKGEAARYTADALTPKIFNEQNKAGNVCFKVIW